jgi:hypothetical protein
MTWEILTDHLRSKAEVKGEAPDLGLGRFSIAGRRWVFGNARRQIKIKLYECNVTVIRRIIDADYRITYNSFTSDTLSATSLYDADNTGRNPSGC